MDGRLLQLADSAFPTGAFAHSGGLEAARQLGLVRSEAELVVRLEELVWHTAWSSVPFLNEAALHDRVEADRLAEVFLSNHVANRASRAQGRAFLMAAKAAFGHPTLGDDLPFGHLAVAQGALVTALGLELVEVRQLALVGSARQALSAAVRLGLVGPLRAQRLFTGLHPIVDSALAASASLRATDAASTAWLVELGQAAHDRLYSRLFQS